MFWLSNRIQVKKQGCVEYGLTLFLCCIIILFVPKYDSSFWPWLHHQICLYTHHHEYIRPWEMLLQIQKQNLLVWSSTPQKTNISGAFMLPWKRSPANFWFDDGILINICYRDKVGVLVKKVSHFGSCGRVYMDFMGFHGEWKMKAWIYFWEDFVQLMPCLEKLSFWTFV